MENKISTELEKVRSTKDFVDLIETNFSKFSQGSLDSILIRGAQDYFNNHTYTPDTKGLLQARKAVAKYYKERESGNNQNIDPEWVFITASTSESYSHIFNSLNPERDTILLPRPGYPLFEYLAGYSKLIPVYYDLIEADGWQPDLSTISKTDLRSAKALVLICPNNPTGRILNASSWQAVAELSGKYDLPLIIDEVFCDFNYSGKNEMPDFNTLSVPAFLLNGISKTLALPDQKLAWFACNDKCPHDLIEDLELANDSYLNANHFIQTVLPELLDARGKVQDPIRKLLQENFKALQSFCQGAQNNVSCVLPAGGIHCMLELDLPAEQEEEIVLGLLKKKHISLHPGYFYDLSAAKAHLVISLLQDPENFAQGLSRIGEFVIEYKSLR